MFHVKPVNLVLLLLSLLFFEIFILSAGCKNGSPGTSLKPSPPDTTKTLVLYLESPGNLKYDVFARISHDSLMLQPLENDSSRGEVRLTRIKNYYFPVYDSVRDKTGRANVDSTRKYGMQRLSFALANPRAIIADMNKNIDSLVKIYAPLPATDTTKNKKDTAIKK